MLASGIAACGGGSTQPAAAVADESLVTPPISPTADVPVADLPKPPLAEPLPAPPPVGDWQQLTVASHSRKVITTPGNGTIGVFTPGKALALEAKAPEIVTGIPARAFSLPVPGERGTVYMVGGLHSNYQGNEIDRISLPVGNASTEITTQISHQPNMPPEGPFSGYASGNGGYIYRQFAGGAIDPTDWQPYPGHQWTKNGWHPDWGVFSLTAHALLNTDGSVRTVSGIPVSSAAQSDDVWPPGTPTAKEDYGVVGFNWSTRKYKTHISTVGKPFPLNLLGESGVSDWNNWDQSLVFLQTNAGITYIQYYRMGGSHGLVSQTPTSVIGGYDGHGGNGILIRSLEQRKYLLLRQDGNGAFKDRAKLMLYSEDFGTGDARFKTLTIPAVFTKDIADNVDGLSYTVDKNGRRVFWLVFPNPGVPLRFYVSTFEDLTLWTQVAFTPDIVIPVAPYADAWIAAMRQPLVFRDGYLYLALGTAGPGNPSPGFTDGTMNWKRVKVDSGEDLPVMSFQRYDYRTQNFRFSSEPGALQLWGVKHTNWAYRPADGKHYLMAGDMGSSTCASMATLQFDGSARGYTFTETLNETKPPSSGTFRPSSPDDGHWFFVPGTSAWVAGRGKFVWMRGGDGEPMFYNRFLREAYGATDSNGTAAQVAAAVANGWDIAAKMYVFDPDTTTFPAKINGSGWTQENGGTFFPDVWTAPSAASRNGAFDATTGVLWRFYDTGSASLAAFDFVNQTVKFFSLATWVSDETNRLIFTSGAAPAQASDVLADGTKPQFCWQDPGSGRFVAPLGLNWEHKATWLDERDGKLYAVAPSTGYLWCFETRGTVTRTVDGSRLPFYPVGQRVPTVGTWPATNARDTYPPKIATNADTRMSQFLVPFKGGLLWWGCCHHDGGTFGHPRYAFWRRLGYPGAWTVVTMPLEFAANTFSLTSKSINNNEVVLLSGGGNYLDTQGPWPFFWRMT